MGYNDLHTHTHTHTHTLYKGLEYKGVIVQHCLLHEYTTTSTHRGSVTHTVDHPNIHNGPLQTIQITSQTSSCLMWNKLHFHV